MSRRWRIGALGLGATLASALALAQQGPESLLPKDYDRPAPRATRTAVPKPEPEKSEAAPVSRPIIAAQPVIGQLPEGSTAGLPPAAAASGAAPTALPSGITSYDQLIHMPQDKLDELLGLKPKDDIPPAARRAMLRIGVLGADEGGLPPFSLAHQDPSLVRAAIAGNQGTLVSRWGHILLRRTLASRLDAPAGLDPADFAALRAGLLVRMGEGVAARALVQDVDPDNYNPALTDAALSAYVATADFTGLCPVQGQVGGPDRKDPKFGQWQVLRAICVAFSGNSAAGFASLDHLTYTGAMPRIDMLLAQKYTGAAGAAGRGGRRAVNIEWNGVDSLTPWRYGLTIGTGLTPPAALWQDADPIYRLMAASAPMLGLGARADAADVAGAAGVLSSEAMIDLYSEIYSDDGVQGDPAERALQLRDAYLADTPAARLAAMKKLWTVDGNARYSRLALTAYAAARLSPAADMAGDAGDLIASMLAAGLDANALRWAGTVEAGSQGWALLALADPRGAEADGSGLDSFRKADTSEKSRKSAFLLAGLAGLARISASARGDMAGKLGVDLDGPTRWTRAIDGAAAVGNPALVALLAGLGMQGDGWDKMTPRYLYHIVRALNRVGLSAEARMIAAEAVARG